MEDGLIELDLVAMMSFIKLGCRVKIALVMALLKRFEAGWLVDGATELTWKESYSDKPDRCECRFHLFGVNGVH